MTTTADPTEATDSDHPTVRAPSQETGPARPNRRWGFPTRDLAALLGVVALLAFLWGRGGGTWFWGDEGISVGISSRALTDIPAVLRLDGSPPLYYLLLHVWTAVFGTSEVATHGLSLVFALAAVPAAFWSGWSLFGRRAGWMCAALVALNPVLGDYANETRMYTLVAFLGVVATASFLHAFVFDRRRFLPLFAASLTLLLYTHNWCILFAVATGVAVLVRMVVGGERRRTFLDAVLVFGAAGLLYAPWVPTLLYQLRHDPNPWARAPTLMATRDDVASFVGGPVVVVLLVLTAGAALTTMFRRPLDRTAQALVCAAVLPVVVSGIGFASGLWHVKYLLVVLGPLALIGAVGMAGSGRTAVVALVAVGFLAGPVALKTPPYKKSNVKAVAMATAPQLRPADLVISPFGDTALLDYYLPPGLRYASPEGYIADPTVPDWRHSMDRIQASQPAVTVPTLLDSVAVDGHLLVVCPLFEESPPDLLPYLDLVARHCQASKEIALADERFRLELSMSPPTGVERTPAAEAHLFTRVPEPL